MIAGKIAWIGGRAALRVVLSRLRRDVRLLFFCTVTRYRPQALGRARISIMVIMRVESF